MAFTRNPATGTPATYTGTNEVDSLVLIDEASNITINSLDENDSVIVSGAALQVGALSNYAVYGNDGSDSLSFTTIQTVSNTLVQGGNDDDTINVLGLAVNSTIRGGADNDFLGVNGASSSTINGNKGSDTVSVSGTVSNARIFGGSDNDGIALNGAVMRNSRANGSDGADTVTVNTGTSMVDSTAFGGAGNDFINIETNDNDLSISGDDGNDVLSVGLIGTGNGDNTINMGSGNDALNLGVATGDNTIDGSTGADVIDINVQGGDNELIFDRGDSIASTANTLGATVANTNTITFGNGVDRIIDATAATQVDIDFAVPGAINNLNGDATTDLVASTAISEIRGTLGANSVFTVDATGADFLYIVGGGNNTIVNAVASSTNIFVSDNLQLAIGQFI